MKLSELQKLAQSMPLSDRPESEKREEFLQLLGLEKGEVYQELEMDSPFVDTHRDVSTASAHVTLHSHSFYELLHCRSCDGVEYLVGKERYRLQKGDVILVAPGVSHCPILPEQMTKPYIRDVLWISQDFIQALNRAFPELFTKGRQYLTLLRTAGTKWEKIGDLFSTGITLAQSDAPERNLALAANTMTLLAQLHSASMDQTARQTRAEKPELLERAVAYISENLQNKLSLEEVAGHFYVSQSTISQVFRNKMGISFHRCVTQLRLIEAKERIAQGFPLESVGEQVGFKDYSTFYRAFRQEFGISPRQYRNLQEAGNK